jgi:hypothetical protein
MRKSPKEVVEIFDRFVNGAPEIDLQDFAKHFGKMHPTIQQKGFRAILMVVEMMANKEYVDGRNRASHNRAKQMVLGLKNEIVKELKEEDAYYWRDEKARDWVFGENYDITSLPLI